MSFLGVKIIKRALSLSATTFTGASDGDTRERILPCHTQTLELSPAGGQTGSIFVFLLQAGKDLSLQTSLPSVTNYCVWFLDKTVIHYCFDWIFSTTYVFHFCVFHFSEWQLIFVLILSVNVVRCLLIDSFKYCLLMMLTTDVFSLFSTLNIVFHCL